MVVILLDEYFQFGGFCMFAKVKFGIDYLHHISTLCYWYLLDLSTYTSLSLTAKIWHQFSVIKCSMCIAQ